MICATGIENDKENISATKKQKSSTAALCSVGSMVTAPWYEENCDACRETFHPKCYRPQKVNTLFFIRKLRKEEVKKLRSSYSLGTRFGRG